MINKVIHYCWFGKNKKSELILKCIESWKKYCPDYEIKEWNEDNFDVNSIPYMKEAYEAKKWAFVSDIARLLIIYKYGGVYLDTDVELFASIDDLLQNEAFFAFESNRNINSGLGFGAIKQHEVIKKMLEYYDNKHFNINGKLYTVPCPKGNTEALMSCYKEFVRNGSYQNFNNVLILSCQVYSEYAKHHGAGTWIDGPRIIHKEYKDSWIKRFMRKPEYFDYIENHFGKKSVQLYTLLAYDLLELGFVYYIKRVIAKIISKE